MKIPNLTVKHGPKLTRNQHICEYKIKTNFRR